MGGEGFVFIEKRIDDIGRDENDKQKNGQRDDPEIEPPAAGALANDGVENPGEEAAKEDGEELDLGPIRSPRRPGLYGDSVKL